MNKEITFETSNEETIKEREDFLSKTVNNLIDIVYNGTNGICHQVFSPIHGLTYEELQALVNAVIDYFPRDCHPKSHNRREYLNAIIHAKKEGMALADTLLCKYTCLSRKEEAEVQYRVYAFLEMKRILTDHFEQL